MKKNFVYYLIAWALLIALYNVIVFVTPNEIAELSKFDSTFWVSYAFVMLCFFGHLVCAFVALSSDKANKLFLRLPLITISYATLTTAVIVGSICMAIPFIPTWVAIIVCACIFVFNTVSVVKAYTASDIVDASEQNIKAKTIFVKSLLLDVDSLLARANSEEVKQELKKLSDTVRYSDPMSNNALSGIESQIIIQFNALTEAVAVPDIELAKAIAGEMIVLLNDRNKKCKLMK